MNLTKLFEVQKELDAKIIHEKNLGDMDRLPYLILALQVELGECANEWRGFKYWSEDQEANTNIKRAKGYNWTKPEHFHLTEDNFENPLLEEYVDCLHFILSIGLNDSELMIYDYDYLPDVERNGNITRQFSKIFYHISFDEWEVVLTNFLGLGEMFGFTWEQIEQAYMDKNAINHERQINGY